MKNLLTNFWASLSRNEQVGYVVGGLLAMNAYTFLAGGAVTGALDYNIVYPVIETVCATDACEYGISPCSCVCEDF